MKKEPKMTAQAEPAAITNVEEKPEPKTKWAVHLSNGWQEVIEADFFSIEDGNLRLLDRPYENVAVYSPGNWNSVSKSKYTEADAAKDIGEPHFDVPDGPDAWDEA